jgi:hypothetical protein
MPKLLLAALRHYTYGDSLRRPGARINLNRSDEGRVNRLHCHQR